MRDTGPHRADPSHQDETDQDDRSGRAQKAAKRDCRFEAAAA